MAKKILFDFLCPDGHQFEELIDSTDNTSPCPTCQKDATRQISNVRLDWRNMGISSDFPTCADKWEKMQRKKPRDDNPNLVMY